MILGKAWSKVDFLHGIFVSLDLLRELIELNRRFRVILIQELNLHLNRLTILILREVEPIDGDLGDNVSEEEGQHIGLTVHGWVLPLLHEDLIACLALLLLLGQKEERCRNEILDLVALIRDGFKSLSQS